MDYDTVTGIGTAETVGGTDLIGGYSVPMDPMDLLQCDSCQ